MTLLLIIVFVTLFISSHCSLFEATLYSTRRGALEAAVAKDERKNLAHKFIDMKRDIGVPISAILILNTVGNTAGATLAGMYAAKTLDPYLIPYFSILFTIAILFIGEIMPKTLGAVYWRTFWPFIVWPLTFMKYALYPAIIVTQKFSNFFTRGATLLPVTEDEILAAVRMGAKAGQISAQESEMVHNIIELENNPIREIMTPRPVLFSLDADLTIREGYRASSQKGFTRVPIYEGDKENVIGYVITHDLGLEENLNRPHATLKSVAKPISFVPEMVNCLTVLTRFLKERNYISMVVDEYGGIVGLITLEDLIETVLGAEIVDERDKVVDLQEAARRIRPSHMKPPS